MGIHTQLPIYKVAYDLLSVAVDYVGNMPRNFKPVIGNRLTQLCMELVVFIVRANCARDKTPHIDGLIEKNDELQILLRICHEKRFISRSQYSKAIELTTSVAKQANGWRKYATSPAT